MSKELSVFEFGGRSLRAIHENGETLVILKDICDYLGVRSRDASRFLDSDEVFKSADLRLKIPNVNRGMLMVNESGLYKVLFRSNREEAKAFTKWVTKEVLPTIRKTGSYTSDVVSIDKFNQVSKLLENAKNNSRRSRSEAFDKEITIKYQKEEITSLKTEVRNLKDENHALKYLVNNKESIDRIIPMEERIRALEYKMEMMELLNDDDEMDLNEV